ncbi:MAG: carbamoyltransferase HypF [Planctomycetes bacterium]|nr:carbamoyltransferase HypF [Planctomycetota bacterium]
MSDRHTVDVRVRGTVQGVGFRPTVWRLAHDEQLVGEVRNDGQGVIIVATGPLPKLERFLNRLETEAPPLARISELLVSRRATPEEFHEFQIVSSQPGENQTGIAPDAAICTACHAEIVNPDERRFGYPFTNCTHCGPRFSIVRRIPYDRANTSMADFMLCSDCRAEYENPGDRRFHAQPIACPKCGPQVWVERPGSSEREATATEALQIAVALIQAGGIVAIRGLGGFHLACDATNEKAVSRLRERKQRYGKPFAMMARDLSVIARYCQLSAEVCAELSSPAAPIVVLERRNDAPLPAAIAPGSDTLGCMLPYTPLHTLLCREFDSPLVMTSGNRSDEPQVTSLADARQRLSGIADLLLMHDREIVNRIDDSVLRIIAGRPRLLRRARGYAPVGITLPEGFESSPDLLAYGGELKNTFCLVKDGTAFISQHLGDLEDAATADDYQRNLDLYAGLFDHQPQRLVADLHPEYLSTKLAWQQSARTGTPLIEVQHHHAHIAACLAEHGVPLTTRPVLGIALDGLGMGDDGTLWGAEFLLADYCGYRRLGTFTPLPLLGGTQAIREPWRNTYAQIASTLGWEKFLHRWSALPLRAQLAQKPLATLDKMFAQGINSPLASSCGRLFDAVAAALDINFEQSLYEGQGACELEALATMTDTAEPYPFSIRVSASHGLYCLGTSPLWPALLDDLAAGVPKPILAGRFHRGLAQAIVELVRHLRSSCAADPVFDTIALSGGCLQNRLLAELLLSAFERDGFRCWLPEQVPANDGGLSLGQAAIAAARCVTGRTHLPACRQ